MAVDIYLREKSGSREIRIPILPEEIKIESGSTIFATVDIMQKGEVAVPTGTELSTYSWDSEFPGAPRKNDSLLRGYWKEPKTYHAILEDWKKSGTELNLLIVGYPYINADVYVKEYQPTLSGAFGDISYKVAFICAAKTTITATTTTGGGTQRPASTSKSYTIKQGDTLWSISLKHYGTGSKWQVIYNANKDIIEKTAKTRWKAAGINRDSQNGKWIFPGITITIPNA